MSYSIPDPRYEELLLPRQKPIGSVVLDTGHPILRDNSLIVLDDKQIFGADVVSSGLKDVVTASGKGKYADGSSSVRIAVNESLRMTNGSPFSWWALFHRIDTSANNARIFERTARNATAQPYLNYGFELSATQSTININVSTATGGGFNTYSWTSAPTSGLVSMAGASDGTNTYAYGQGNLVGTVSTFGIDDIAGIGDDLYIGGYAPTSYQDTGAVFLIGGVWQRQLSETEIKELYKNPYQFLIPA